MRTQKVKVDGAKELVLGQLELKARTRLCDKGSQEQGRGELGEGRVRKSQDGSGSHPVVEEALTDGEKEHPLTEESGQQQAEERWGGQQMERSHYYKRTREKMLRTKERPSFPPSAFCLFSSDFRDSLKAEGRKLTDKQIKKQIKKDWRKAGDKQEEYKERGRQLYSEFLELKDFWTNHMQKTTDEVEDQANQGIRLKRQKVEQLKVVNKPLLEQRSRRDEANEQSLPNRSSNCSAGKLNEDAAQIRLPAFSQISALNKKESFSAPLVSGSDPKPRIWGAGHRSDFTTGKVPSIFAWRLPEKNHGRGADYELLWQSARRPPRPNRTLPTSAEMLQSPFNFSIEPPVTPQQNPISSLLQKDKKFLQKRTLPTPFLERNTESKGSTGSAS